MPAKFMGHKAGAPAGWGGTAAVRRGSREWETRLDCDCFKCLVQFGIWINTLVKVVNR